MQATNDIELKLTCAYISRISIEWAHLMGIQWTGDVKKLWDTKTANARDEQKCWRFNVSIDIFRYWRLQQPFFGTQING